MYVVWNFVEVGISEICFQLDFKLFLVIQEAMSYIICSSIQIHTFSLILSPCRVLCGVCYIVNSEWVNNWNISDTACTWIYYRSKSTITLHCLCCILHHHEISGWDVIMDISRGKIFKIVSFHSKSFSTLMGSYYVI